MSEAEIETNGLSAGVLAAMIAATCLLLGNIYYAQPILLEIANSLQIGMDDSGLIVAFGQLGYIGGLLFLAPLGDTLDNRRLCSLMALGAAGSAIIASFANLSPIFLASMFLMGAFATATQILIVFATILSGPRHAGRTLGIMASGLFLGIALSRPVASIVTTHLGWRCIYGISGICLLLLSVWLYVVLPSSQIKPSKKKSYFGIIGGMLILAFRTRKFSRYAILSGFAFMGFSMFWSSAPLYLSEGLNCSQNFITVFTMTGLITPAVMLLVGWLLDRGYNSRITIIALGLIFLGWLLIWLAPAALWPFFTAAFMIDPCSSATTVTVQKTLLTSVAVDKRGRVNSLNISLNFLGGTLGAALGPWLLGIYSWKLVALTGLLMGAALLVFDVLNQISERSMQDG